jgi:integrase
LGSIEKHVRNGRTTYQVRWRDPAGKQKKQSFRRKVDAERHLIEVEGSKHAGTYVDPRAGRTTVAEYAATWLERQPQLRPSTLDRYQTIIRVHIAPTFGTLPLSRLERSAVAAWVSEMSAAGLAGATVRHVHRVLVMVLNSAAADGRIARNVAAGVPLPRAAARDKRFLTHAEVAALAAAAGDDGTVVRVLAYCGLRFGELAALQVRNVDLRRRRLTIAESATEVAGRMVVGAPKSGAARSVPFPRSLVGELEAACAGKAPEDLVFTAPEGGVLWLRNWRRRVFEPAAAAAGLDGLTPHGLRHTAASLAVSAGANVKHVQRMLGHASAAMTLDVYSGLFDDDLDAVADRLGEAAAAAVPRSCPEDDSGRSP